ncbi:MAG: hypothetical protein ACFB21_11840 [Opitutales bacterium]
MPQGIAVPTLRERMLKQSLEDSWWLAVDGTPMDKPLRLRTIEMTLKDEPDREYHIINVRAAEQGHLDWEELFLTPRLRTSSSPSSQESGGGASGNSAQLAEIAELKARVNLLENNQARLQETVAELKMMLRQSMRERPRQREVEEGVDDDQPPSRPLYPHEQPMSKAEQLRSKLRKPNIRLVG